MARPTIKDVAAKAGVSIATVSNVFSGRKAVTPEVAQRVTEAARSLSYKLDQAASQLRSGRVRVIGMLVPSLDDTFFASFVSHIEGLACEEGYQVLVASSGDSREHEAAQLEALLGWKPSGVIAVPCTNVVPEPLRQAFGALPMVLTDRVGEDDLPVDTIVVDNYGAGRAAAENVLGRGHRNILIAASVASLRPIAERIRGISEACAETAGCTLCVLDLGPDSEPGARILGDWLDTNPQPSAVIAMTNVTTLASLSAFAARGLDVPDRISLVGFDDYAWMTARKVPLSAIRQPIAEIAKLSWTRLMARIGGDKSEARRIILEAPLQVRSSVSPPA